MLYLANLGYALSCLGNALMGGLPTESLSLRIGRSILRNGIAARLPIPSILRGHFIRVAMRDHDAIIARSRVVSSRTL